MIRLVCNKCNKELDPPVYYTISINKHDLRPDRSITRTTTTTALTYGSKDYLAAIRELNSTQHYCEDCIKKIKKSIKVKEDE